MVLFTYFFTRLFLVFAIVCHGDGVDGRRSDPASPRLRRASGGRERRRERGVGERVKGEGGIEVPPRHLGVR